MKFTWVVTIFARCARVPRCDEASRESTPPDSGSVDEIRRTDGGKHDSAGLNCKLTAECPSHVTVAGESNEPLWESLLFAFGLVLGPFAIVAGFALLVRTAHRRRILRHHPMMRAHITTRSWTERSAWVQVRGNVVALTPDVPTDSPTRLLRIASATTRTIRQSGIAQATELAFAGDPDRYVVAWFPTTNTLLTLRRPSTTVGQRQLADRFSRASTAGEPGTTL
jgi:hypothetical protein